jgi:hypothetical protein
VAVGEIVAALRGLFNHAPNPGGPTVLVDGSAGIAFDEVAQDVRIRRLSAGLVGTAGPYPTTGPIDFAALGLRLGTTSVILVRTAAGSPEGVVVAPVGSLYLRDDGGASSTLYIKESGVGNVGWVAVGGTGVPTELANLFTNGEAGAITHGQAVYCSTAAINTVLLADASADDAAARVIGFVRGPASILAAATGLIRTDGVSVARLEPALVLVTGDEIFLSAAVPGSCTNVAPAAATQVVKTVGYLKDTLTYNGVGDLLVSIQIERGPKAVV